MKKRIISIVLILVVLVLGGLLAGKALIGNQVNVSWYSDDETEFVIETADQLYELVEISEKRDLKGKTFKLGADIVVNEGNADDWATNAPERKWYPIKNFAGTFDGQGHTISGLYGNIYDKAMGLFVNTEPSSVIKDFKLVNTYFKSIGSPGTAGIAGGVKNSGTFEKIYTDAIIDCDGIYTAGIVSFVTGGDTKLSECWFDGTITRYYYNHTGGGLVAQVNASTLTIEHCLNSGTIVNDDVKDYVRVGGICGVIGSAGQLVLNDCLSTGVIETEKTKQVGSVVGFVGTTSMADFKTVFATKECFGAAVGNGSERVQGGVISFDREDILGPDAYRWTNLDFENYWTIKEGDTPELQYFADTKMSVEGLEKVYDISWFTGKESEYTLTTKEQLYGFALLSSSEDFTNITVKLGADIVVNEGDAKKWAKEAPANFWIPIMNWTGTFDGQGHTISGIYLEGSGTLGLFLQTKKDSVVKNLRLTNSYYKNNSTSNAYTGGIAGQAGGLFDTIYSDVIIESTGIGAGGIVGYLNAGIPKVTNCWYNGKITLLGDKAHSAGGIVGFAVVSSTVEHCLNTGDISAERTDNYVRLGGICGVVGSKAQLGITDCLNTGLITGFNKQAGSIIGFVGTTASAKLDTVCTTMESYSVAVGQGSERCTGLPIQYKKADLIGAGGYEWTNLDFAKYWVAVKNGTPMLKSFATSSMSTKGLQKKFDISWYNKDKKSFTITDAKDLYGVSILAGAGESFEGKTIKLGADITVNNGDATTWSENPPADSWIPISGFVGTFDGQGHTISGLYKNGGTNIGLFANSAEKTVIKNLTVENSYFANKTETGNVYIGGIVGQGGGTIHTVYSDVIIETTGIGAAGIIGYVKFDKTKITNCWFAGDISLLGEKAHSAAGIAAIINKNLTLEACLNSGNLSTEKSKSYTRTAGILGVIGSESVVHIKDSLNVGEITSAKNQAGSVVGFVGTKATLTIDADVYASVESYITQIGMAKGTVTGSVNKVAESALKSEKAKTNASGLDFDKYWMTLSKRTPILKSFAAKAPALDQRGMTPDTSWYNKTDKIFVLTTPEQLYGVEELSYDTDFAGITIKLGADITVNSGDASTWGQTAPQYVWSPIQSFAGTFDGQGHTISGLYNADGVRTGLFGETTEKSVIKNLSIKNSYFANMTATGAVKIGGVAAKGNGTFDTIYVDTIIETTGNTIGGIIASVNTVSDNNIIRNCWFAGKLILTGESAHTAGGIVGEVGEATSSNPVVPGSVKVENCLVDAGVDENNNRKVQISNAGRALNSKGEIDYLRIGGICGIASKKGSSITMTDSLVLGKIVTEENLFIGSIAGYITGDPKASVDGVYASTESYTKAFGKASVSGVLTAKEEKYIGKGAFTTASGLDFATYWTAIDGKTPILRSFLGNETALESEKYDTSWYTTTEEGASFVITTESQLFGLAELSKTYDFNGQIIYLGADITVNTLPEGKTAEYWLDDANAPEKIWTPIGSEVAFAGEFNGYYEGEMHTISGLYTNSGANVGLFAQTTADSTIQNLRLVNSCFVNHGTTGQVNIGSIVGRGAGKIDTVYTDAVISTTGTTIGGIIASVITVSDKNIVNNCWFAGKLFLNGSSAYTAGGIVGEVGEATSKDPVVPGSLMVKNCLVDAGLNADGSRVAQFTSTGRSSHLRIGGLCGIASKKGTKLTLEDSVILGKISITTGKNTGSIIGHITTSDVTLTRTDIYVLKDCYSNLIGNTAEKADSTNSIEDETTLYGWNAVTNATGLEYGTIWAPIDGETPVLISFLGDRTIAEEPEKEPTDPEQPTDPVEPTGPIEITEYEANKTATEFVIKNVEQLYKFAELSASYTFAGQTIYLDADITVNKGTVEELLAKATDNDDTNNPRTWTPIGDSSHKFAGTFDGQGYAIKGLYYNLETGTNIGLFGYTAASCTITDLRLENSYFKGAQAIGNVAGQGGGTFDTIYSNAYIECAQHYYGGIIGLVNAPITNSEIEANLITNCQFEGTLIGTKAKYASSLGAEGGGMVGRVDSVSLTIEHCLNAGTVKAENIDKNSRIGGICGIVAGTDPEVTIKDSLNVGKIIAAKSGKVPCAIVGQKGGKAQLYLNDVYALEGSCGKFNDDQTDATTMNPDIKCGFISADNLKGDTFKTNTTLSYDKGDNTEYYWVAQTIGTPVLKSFSLYDLERTRFVIDDVVELYELAVVASKYDLTGKTFCLGADITVNAGTPDVILARATDDDTTNDPVTWTPIGTSENPFKGTFDGQGYAIKGLYYNSETGKNIGLFGYTAASCTITDLRLENSYFKGAQAIGNVAGQGGGTFDTIYSNAYIECSEHHYGGIIGLANAVISNSETETNLITNCQFEGTLVGTKAKFGNGFGAEAGGMVGRVDGVSLTIEHCLNAGTVKNEFIDKNSRIGGMCGVLGGSANVTIKDSLNVGEIIAAEAGTLPCAIAGLKGKDAKLYLNDVYALEGSCVKFNNAQTSETTTNSDIKCGFVSADNLKGEAFKTKTTLSYNKDDNTEYYWVAGTNHPVLKAFAPETPTQTTSVMSLFGRAVAVVASLFN